MPNTVQPNKFPSKEELERISGLRKFQMLYEGRQYPILGLHDMIKKQYKKEKDIVYLSSPIPAYISDFYGDFVAGNTDKLVFEAGIGETEAQKKEAEQFVNETLFHNDLREKITDIATEQSEFGFYVIYGWLDDEGIYHLDRIPQDQYFPQPDGSVVIATYKKDPRELGNQMYLLTKHFRVENGNLVVESKAWRTDNQGVISQEITLEKMAQVLGKDQIEPIEIIKGLDDIPIRQIDNGVKSRGDFGKSDYADVIPQLAEINERSTHIATALLKNLDSKMMLPASMFNEDGSIKPFESIAIQSKDDPKAEYVINNNPLLVEAREHIISQIRLIALATSVPVFELLKTAQPERVESLRIQLFAAVRKTQRKRAKIARALKDMFRIGFKLKGMDWATEQDVNLRFEDVLPTEEIVQAETERTKVAAGLTSKKSAIMRLEGMSPEEADEELQRIKDEDLISGFTQL